MEKYAEKNEVNQENQIEPEEEPQEPQEPIVDSSKPMIALTFDDGPSVYTNGILDILAAHDARATFFVLGPRAEKYTGELARMEEMFCEIGNHTYNHIELTKLTQEQIAGEINATNEAIKRTLGRDTTLVRPPYGAVNDIVMASVTHPVVLWSVDTTDWQLKDANAVASHILNIAQDGDIVLLHDIYQTTLDAMQIVIPELKARGYQLVTVSEMVEARGAVLENGQKYFHFR